MKETVDKMEKEIAELRHEVEAAKNARSVSPDKALVAKKSLYEMIIFEGD
jgi:MerR family transcriptional regulator/heat shock protein HspR